MKGGVVVIVAMLSATAHAQTMTTGAIEGRVVDATGAPIAGITVTVARQSARTDGDGRYRITLLPPGDYAIRYSPPNAFVSVHRDVHVGVQQVTQVFERLGRLPDQLRDQLVGVDIDRTYLTTIPIPGRLFDAALGATPGSQSDSQGVAFSGSSSLENRYLLDGGDITELTYGFVGTTVPNEFIQDIAVITGGENAEYGRATGGIVNIATRSGTNELRGSVFGYLSPSWLVAPAKALPANPATIDSTAQTAYDASVGFELGGPIVKDRLWFYAGFAPQLARVDYTRTVESQTDCRKVIAGKLSACEAQYADGVPDVDPKTGLLITDTVASEVRAAPSQSYPAIAKLDFAPTPDHQGSLGVLVVPSTNTQPGIYGFESTGTHTTGLTTDVSGRWTSKLRDDAIELEAQVAWHRAASDTGAIDPSLNSVSRKQLLGEDFTTLAKLGGESAAAVRGCTDGGPSDKYPLITNCPDVASYAIGGPGTIDHEVQDRRSARFAITGRVEAFGAHELKAGFDLEDDTQDLENLDSGGAYVTQIGNSTIIDETVKLAPIGDTDPRFNQICTTVNPNPGPGILTYRCEQLGYTPGAPGADSVTQAINSAGYLRDSWRPRPNLIVDLGLRYEDQRLFYPNDVRGTTDPVNGVARGETLLDLSGNFAPRIGITYDPTDEGRAKIFAHWGRFFESVPMDLLNRSSGETATFVQQSTCRNPPTCTMNDFAESLLGEGTPRVAPGTKAEYMDELVAGAQLEIVPSVVVGATYVHRQLGRVIEDVSTDGAYSFVIANPGVYDPSIFDKPTRDYNALELTAARTFSRRFYVRASYTYSRSEGDYPGAIGANDGQVDPNVAAQYDLVELLANRKGPLPQDRPQYFKVDGSYTLPIGRGAVIVGARFRALSGTPELALGAHYLYGENASFLLPSSALGRTDADTSLDVHLAYRRRLPHRTAAEVFADIFNVYDHQGAAAVDTTYTTQNANPVSRGSYADLIWLKTIDATGVESAVPVIRNVDFLRPTQLYVPLYVQLGFRLMF